MKALYIATMIASSVGIQASHAGMFMEGLEPFQIAEYCDGLDRTVDDPHVIPLASVWENNSPDGHTLKGKPAWDAEGCHGKLSTKAPAAPRKVSDRKPLPPVVVK